MIGVFLVVGKRVTVWRCIALVVVVCLCLFCNNLLHLRGFFCC